MGPVGHDLDLVDGENVGGSEQEMVEMGFVYVYIPLAVECSPNCPGARLGMGDISGRFF